MVKTLLRNKEDNYFDYDRDYLEKCLSRHFEVVRHEWLEGHTRILYYAETKRRSD